MAIVRDLMSPVPATVGPETTLAESARLMVERGVRHLPVVDRASKPLGMLSDMAVFERGGLVGASAELWVSFAEDEVDPPAGELAVETICVPPSTSALDALSRMLRSRVDAMCCVGDDGGIVGVVTEHDAVVWAALLLYDDTAVGTVASRPVRSIVTSRPASDAWDLMKWHGIRHVLVTEADGSLYGVVSVRDLVSESIPSGREIAAEDVVRVGEVHTVDHRMSVRQAAQKMVKHHVGCLPVMEDGAVVAVLTRTDVIRAALPAIAVAGGTKAVEC